MTKDKGDGPPPLDEMVAEFGALARSGIEMQQAGLDMLMAEVKLALHAIPGGIHAKPPEDPADPAGELFDNMPV